MKSLLKISLVLVAILLIGTSVNAATVDEFIAYITSAQTVAGESVYLVTDAQVTEIERYLSTNSVSESDLDYLQTKFDEGVAILDAAGVSSYSELTESEKASLVALADEASSQTGIDFVIGSDASVTVYNLDGTVATTTTGSIIKQTGSSNYVYAVVAVIAIVAVAIALISRRRLANAK